MSIVSNKIRAILTSFAFYKIIFVTSTFYQLTSLFTVYLNFQMFKFHHLINHIIHQKYTFQIIEKQVSSL